MIQVLVGKKVPEFKAEAFVKGDIKKISVDDYKGQWLVLCFYPGDFTFV
jgi:peroxiredoxin (alkyl hydroperoxide reductase subunit C)